ncbi:alpha/beta hydrolase [Streptomyces sp. GMY02]|uniref:alpha/beta fold hydrolase n=1 Tax=Streptomyces sp. GMY02 TaxID=1333528 RepID=UPI001C2C8255|nr:alpha/beta hydrolase [Streptomyces sp. GMY02]QXE33545.1 alpha/beta hydrolase [Streptomyces sp. GMY02]
MLSHRRSRLIVVGAVSVALAAGIAASATASPDTASAGKSKPTVVLVHGAWADASSWDGVTKRLQADGYTVVAPANPLRGLSSDAKYLSDYLKTVKGPVVLAGHSYGGAVITNAAAGNSNVKGLVYIAAFAPDEGESASALGAKFPGSHLSDDPTAQVPTSLNAVPFTQADGSFGVDLYIKPDKYRDVFLSNSLGTKNAAALAAAQRPITPQALGEPSGTPAWKTIPSWYLIASNDNTLPPAAQKYMADRAHSRTVKVDAPHAATVTNPGAVTNLIEKAAAGR